MFSCVCKFCAYVLHLFIKRRKNWNVRLLTRNKLSLQLQFNRWLLTSKNYFLLFVQVLVTAIIIGVLSSVLGLLTSRVLNTYECSVGFSGIVFWLYNTYPNMTRVHALTHARTIVAIYMRRKQWSVFSLKIYLTNHHLWWVWEGHERGALFFLKHARNDWFVFFQVCFLRCLAFSRSPPAPLPKSNNYTFSKKFIWFNSCFFNNWKTFNYLFHTHIVVFILTYFYSGWLF